MPENVVSLTGDRIDGQPCPYVIAALEDMLARAKRGEIIAIAGGWVSPAEQPFTFNAGDRFASLLGALTVCQLDMIENARDA